MLERARWEDAWRVIGAPAPEGLLAELVARYAEPHRAYHTLQHIRECFAELEPASSSAERLPEVQIALWFHDAIYDTSAQDNEEQSARWAHASLVANGASPETAARVHSLVLATKHDGVPEGTDAKLLVDVDLSILGAADSRFAEYERQVREEYSWVSEAAFRQGRARVLASFLERPSIYSTPWFVSRLEERARTNLSRSLRELTAS
jgi:predicted metal-dependent HD superfamily phosphohydrolase